MSYYKYTGGCYNASAAGTIRKFVSETCIGICNEQNNEKDIDIDGDAAFLAACDTGPAVNSSFM